MELYFSSNVLLFKMGNPYKGLPIYSVNYAIFLP